MSTASEKTLSPEVLVVGAGIAGTSLAIALKRRGLHVLLVERNATPKKIFKGEYLQPAAVRFLEQFDLLDKLKTGEWIRELRFRDVDSRGDVVSDLLMEYPDGLAARSVEHHDLLEALTELAKNELGESYWPGTQLAPLVAEGHAFRKAPVLRATRGQTVTTLRPRWVVGCDGRNSSVRKWSGGNAPPRFEAVTLAAPPEWIVGLEVPQSAPLRARYEVYRSHGQGTIALFSLGEGHQRLYFSQPVDRSGAENPVRVASEQIRRVTNGMQTHGFKPLPLDGLVPQAYPAGTGWYGDAARGRVFLAGDALAVTTPFGGQGMTAAIENVESLLEEYPWREKDAGHIRRAQQNYARAARATHDRVNLLNLGLYYLFFSRQPWLKLPTKHIIRTWQKDSALTERVMRLFAGLDRDQPRIAELLELWGIPTRDVRLRQRLPAFLRLDRTELFGRFTR